MESEISKEGARLNAARSSLGKSLRFYESTEPSDERNELIAGLHVALDLIDLAVFDLTEYTVILPWED